MKWLNLEILLVEFGEVQIDLARKNATMAELRQCLMETAKSSEEIEKQSATRRTIFCLRGTAVSL